MITMESNKSAENATQVTTGSQFYYLGGLFTIGHISEKDDIIYTKDDKGNISDMSLSLFKSGIRNGFYVMKVPQVKSVDTPKCKCGGRTALSSGRWYYEPDEEPYESGKNEVSKVPEGDAWVHGFICDDCGSVQNLFVDENSYQSRITQLEKQNSELREVLRYSTSQFKRLIVDMPEVCGDNPLLLDCIDQAGQALNLK